MRKSVVISDQITPQGQIHIVRSRPRGIYPDDVLEEDKVHEQWPLEEWLYRGNDILILTQRWGLAILVPGGAVSADDEEDVDDKGEGQDEVVENLGDKKELN